MYCTIIVRHELDLFRKWEFGDTSDLNNVGFVLSYFLIRCSVTYAGKIQ